jgi:Fe-S-cluster containining protein
MPENMPIRILSNHKTEKHRDNGSKITALEIDIFNRRLGFHIIAAGNAQLADIVPAARIICDKITDITTKQIRIQGGSIPCHKGCATCCSYLVSLSVPEALRFRQEFFLKQKYRPSQTLRTYLSAAKRIISHRPPDQVLKFFSNSSDNPFELNLLSDWYAGLNLVCPFLCNSLCTIYQQRPFVCREHFVSNPVHSCYGNCDKGEIIEMPVQMGTVLCRLTKKLCDVGDAVMMPLALAWCEVNKQLCELSWPAAKMAKLFVEIIKETVSAPAYC